MPRVAPDRIIIGATHTHSAPDCYAFPDGKGGHTGSLAYMQFVVERTAAAINEALDRMQPAELRVGSGVAKGKIAYNYYAPDLYDRRVSVLQVRAANAGPMIGTLVNYAIHPEVLGNEQGILSPDLCGPLYERMEQQAGGVAVFFNGAQGGMVTADNRDLEKAKDALRGYWEDSRTWAECERIGRLLADESLRVADAAPWQKGATVKSVSRQVRFPVDSNDLWAVVRFSPLKYPHGADRTIASRVNLVSIGNARLLTIPGEALPNIGLYLKRKMGGEHQFLLGLTNDAFGYMMTKVDFRSFERYDYISRVSLGEMTGEIFIENALEMIREAGGAR